MDCPRLGAKWPVVVQGPSIVPGHEVVAIAVRERPEHEGRSVSLACASVPVRNVGVQAPEVGLGIPVRMPRCVEHVDRPGGIGAVLIALPRAVIWMDKTEHDLLLNRLGWAYGLDMDRGGGPPDAVLVVAVVEVAVDPRNRDLPPLLMKVGVPVARSAPVVHPRMDVAPGSEVGEEWPVGVGLEASGLEVGIYGGVLVRRGVEIRCPENGEVRGEAERGGGCPCRGPVDQPPRCTAQRPVV